MSWATISSNSINYCVDDAQNNAKSEEAALHDLRTAYNQALHLMISSTHPGDLTWIKSLEILEGISREVFESVVVEPTRSQMMEIAFLANKNIIEAYSKHPALAPSTIYQLSLDTVQLMLDLGKSDILLILQTARYAREANDLWTYQQLMLSYSDELPCMYKDIVMKQFAKVVESRTLVECQSQIGWEMDVSEHCAATETSVTHDWKLQDTAAQEFVQFLFTKIFVGEETSQSTLIKGFNPAWITAPSADEISMEVSEADTVPSDTTPPPPCPHPHPPLTSPVTAEGSDCAITCDTSLAVPSADQPHQLEQQQQQQQQQLQSEAAQELSSRRSGRSGKKTAAADAVTLAVSDMRTRAAVSIGEEDCSAAAAVPEAAGSSSLTVESAIGCRQDAYGHSASIMRIFAQDTGNFGTWYGSVYAGDCEELHRQADALRFAFVLPSPDRPDDDVTSSQGDSKRRQSADRAGKEGVLPAHAAGAVPQVTWSAQTAASLFEAFRAYIASAEVGQGWTERMHLYVSVLQFLADDAHWPLLCAGSFASLDTLALQCWRGLVSMQTSSTQQLLARVNHDEELLLLECALSYSGVEQESRDHTLLATAHELLTLLMRQISAVPLSKLRGEWNVWQRYESPVHQMRAVWAVVAACRSLSPPLSAGEGSPRDLLQQLSTLLSKEDGDERGVEDLLSVHLPHARSTKWHTISRAECMSLLSTLQHEGEVKELVRSHAATRAWVKKALALLRKEDQLRTMMTDGAGGAGSGETARCIPAMLLEACEKLGEGDVWLGAVAVLFSEALHASSAALADADPKSLEWVGSLLDLVVSHTLLGHRDAKFSAKKLTATTAALSSLMVAFAPHSHGSSVADDVVTRCLDIGSSLLKRSAVSSAGAVRTILRNSVVQALVDAAQGCSSNHSVGSNLASTHALWCRYLELNGLEDSAALSSPPLSVGALTCLIKLAVDSRQRVSPQSHLSVCASLLLVLLRLVVEAPGEYLAARARAELLVLLRREYTEQCEIARRQARSSASTKKRPRSSSAPTTSSATKCASTRVVDDGADHRAAVAALLMKTLEDVLMQTDFYTHYPQREQRSLIAALGLMYHTQYGLLIAIEGVGAEDEDLSVNYDFAPAALVKLYSFTILCRDRGWVGKAEVRAALLQLSRAPVLVQAIRDGSALSVILQLLRGGDVAQEELLTRLTSAARSDNGGCANSEGAELRAVAAEIYHALLDVGVTASELYVSDDEGEDSPASGTALEAALTSLKAECAPGSLFEDPRGAFNVACSLRDLSFNPLRRSSWQHLVDSMMECFNALCDELQQECLVDQLQFGAGSNRFVAEAVDALIPPIDEEVRTDRSVCIWTPAAPVLKNALAAVVDSSVSGLEAAAGQSLIQLFEPTMALETLANRKGCSVDAEVLVPHLRRLAFLVAVRDAAFSLIQRLRQILRVLAAVPARELARAASGAAKGGEGEGDTAPELADQIDAEMYALVLSNATKSRTKGDSEKARLKATMAQCLAQDCCFGDDLFALTTVARVTISQATDSPAQLSALQLCLRAARALKAESGSSRNAYSKPVRVVAICEVCAVCTKACLQLLRGLEDSAVLAGAGAGAVLSLMEECLQTLVKWPAVLPCLSSPAGTDAAEGQGRSLYDRVLRRTWIALAVSLFGLRECRRLDAFEFRSVYRLSRTLHALSDVLAAHPHLQPASEVAAYLCSINVRDFSAAAALEEQAKLFDKKRPQIVAMWCVENATSAWELELVRVSQFDSMRRKYIDWYLALAEECSEWEVILDVLAFALSAARHATSVVLHVLYRGICALHAVLLPLLILLPEQAPAEAALPEAAEGCMAGATKRDQLVSSATRVLQAVYELHCHVQDRVPATAVDRLRELMDGLVTHSSLPAAPASLTRSSSAMISAMISAMDCSSSTGEAGAENAAQLSALLPAVQSSNVPAVLSEADPTLDAAQSTLTRCAARWGACKQLNKTEIGKRSKGYFFVAALERSQSRGALRAAAEEEEESAGAAGIEREGEGEGGPDAASRQEVAAVVAELVGSVLLQGGAALYDSLDEVGQQNDNDATEQSPRKFARLVQCAR